MSVNSQPVSLKTRLIASVVSLVLFMVVIELALAVISPNLYHRNQFFPRNRDIDFPDVYKRDARLMWRFRPGITTSSRLFSNLDYTINSLGMRGPEPSDDPGAYRIIALGNSCTFGWGVPLEDTWVRRLERLLNEQLPGRKIELINAGVPGYSSFQGKRYLADELLELKPDMVLVMFGNNDHYPAGRGISDSAQQLDNSLLIKAQNLLSRLRLYQLLRKLLLSLSSDELPRLDELGGVKRVSRPEFFSNLREIVGIVRKAGAQPVLLVPPVASLEGYFGEGISSFHQLHKVYQQEIVRASQYEAVPLIDLQAVFDRYNTLYNSAADDPIHFNSQGHAVAAETIAEIIAPLIGTQ